MSRSPAATVVIPTWNSTRTLPRALASIEDQAGGVNILVVDDCSNDQAALQAIAEADPRVTLLVKEARINAAHSRAIGLKQAGGDLVLFLDSDDHFAPDHIARRRALHSAQAAAIILGRFRLNDGTREWDGPMPAYAGGDIEDYIFAQGGDVRSSTLSVDKSRLRATTFDARLAKHQDWGFALAACRNGESIGFDPEPGVVISLAGETRMSRRSDVEASLRFVREHVRAKSNQRRFLLARLRTSLRLGDMPAARQFRRALLDLNPPAKERFVSAGMMLAGELGLARPLHRLIAAAR